MTEPHTSHQSSHADVHHETSDVDIRGIFAFAIGLAVTAIVIHGLIWLLFGYFEAREARDQRPAEFPLAQPSRLPPEPRLQTNPRGDLRQLRTTEDAILTSYGWIDKDAGVVQIPIDQAMKVTVERGLPARQATNAGR